MDNLMKGRTNFVIAHRLSTVKNADLILVMAFLRNKTLLTTFALQEIFSAFTPSTIACIYLK
jgi:ABC-type multidrug transport system fused ATPase/permease subunit